MRCEFGFQIECATTANEVLSLAMRFDFNFVLIEWEVGVNGRETLDLCSRLRQARPSINLVVLGATAAPDDVIAALDAGADDYIVTSTGLEELMARFRALVRR